MLTIRVTGISAGTSITNESSETSKRDVSNGLDSTVQTVQDEASKTPIENHHIEHSLKSISKRLVDPTGVGGVSGKTKRLKVCYEGYNLQEAGKRLETTTTQSGQQDEPGCERV
jgi:hypothetical protein